ncbi:hypothetical protein B0H19DRAFT_1247370 [Mycena capillaripes]|nr:hypothetical protein B0H19DRAFT_1247370 [Mycena capillaripes]
MPSISAIRYSSQLPILIYLEWDIFRVVLSGCKGLTLLVALWPRQTGSDAEEFSAQTPFRDARFVVATSASYWEDWVAGAEGRNDFWTAEAFVARKRRGEIADSRYWMGAPH